MRWAPGELVFVELPFYAPGKPEFRYWAIVLARPTENSRGNMSYSVFCSDGKKRSVEALYLRHPREVKPIYQGEREGNPEGGKPDPDSP